MSLVKLVTIVVAIVVGVIILVQGPGALTDLIKVFNENTVDKVTFGVEEIKGREPTVPEHHRSAALDLFQKIESLAKTTDNLCFVRYNPLPDLGEKGTSLLFQSETGENKKLIFTLFGGEGGVQPITTRVIEGINGCVVEGDSAENFYSYFLARDALLLEDFAYADYYRLTNQIVISYEDAFFSKGNRINYGRGLEHFHEGILFKTKDNNVCFFEKGNSGDLDLININALGECRLE